MNRLLGLMLLVLGRTAQSQTANYTISGKLGNYNAPSKIYFYRSAEGKTQTDSAVLKNGAFAFKGTVRDPFSGVLIMDHKGVGFNSLSQDQNADALNVYVEKASIIVQGADSVSKAKITGSALNNDNQKLRFQLKPVQDKLGALIIEYRNSPDSKKNSEDFVSGFRKRSEVLQTKQKEILKNFVKENPASYVSLDVIGAIAGQQPDFAEIEPLFNSLSPKLKQTGAGKALAGALQEGKKNAVGSVAAEFSQKDVNGRIVKLSDYRGKYLLLDFWASWCGPCRQENPNVVRVYNKYKDKNFDILGVSLDRESGKGAWLKAIKDDRLTWTQVSDLKFWQNEAAVLYGVQAIPQNFLLDPQGKIIAKNLRGDDLEVKLADLIK